jgi:SAM-dependent methyltransferase
MAGDAMDQAQRRLNEVVVGLAAVGDGMAVLDVGCGVGGTLASIAEEHTGLRLTGLNLDERQLEIARREVFPGTGNTADWIQGDGCALPFEPASFDRVLAVECQFHFPSRRRFFAEVARVLRPGGLLALSDFVPSEELRRLRKTPTWPAYAVAALLQGGLGPWPDPWGDEGTLEELGDAVRLKVVTTLDATAETLPSFSSFLSRVTGADGPELNVSAMNVVDRSVATLGWLQSRGLFRMQYVLLQKA